MSWLRLYIYLMLSDHTMCCLVFMAFSNGSLTFTIEGHVTFFKGSITHIISVSRAFEYPARLMEVQTLYSS